MPIPFLLIGGIVAAVAVGGGCAISATNDNNEAEDNNKKAKDIIEKAKASLSRARDESKDALEKLGNKKIDICQTSITRFVSLFEQIKDIELRDSDGLQELGKFKIDRQAVIDLKKTTAIATSIASGAVSGTVVGGAVAFGAWSMATAFASASTGTAIATLSGAAATNATLAFFGGGSLAAGGLGIAGGMWVLGGMVAGPAIAVLGIILAANASKNLDKSKSNIAKAEEIQKEIDVMNTACYGVTSQANLFTSILIQLNSYFDKILDQMESVIRYEGTDYKLYSREAKDTIAASLSLAQAVKAVLDTPILNQDGSISEDSKEVSNAICEEMNIEIPEASTPNPDSSSDDTARLEEKIKELIAKQLDVSKDQLNEYTLIAEDLNADSLDIVELIMAFEEELGSEIPDEDAERLRTVGDIVEYAKCRGFKA